MVSAKLPNALLPHFSRDTKIALGNGIEIKNIDSQRIDDLLQEDVVPNSLILPDTPSKLGGNQLIPLSLKEVEKLVEANNPYLKALSIRIEEAKALLVEQLSAWYPTIDLLGNGLPEYLSGKQYRNSDFSTTPKTKSERWNTSISLQVKWDLINPARVPQIAAARDTFERTKAGYMIGLRDTKLDAMKRYFTLQLADEGVRIGTQSIKASLVSLRDARARYKAGVATKLEVLQAESQLSRDKQLLSRKQADQQIARRSLATILNLPNGVIPTAASSAEVLGIWEPTLQESIIAAYKFREELNQLKLDISINNSKANAALAGSQPTVSIVNTYSFTRYQGQSLVDSNKSIDMNDYGWNSTNTIGLTTIWPIFDGGRSKSIYRYNKLLAKESKANFVSESNRIKGEVQESFFNLKSANQNIGTMRREILASREALRLSRLRFQAGVTTQREVVNAQRDLTGAEVRYSDAITIYNTSLAQLQRRTGLDKVLKCRKSTIKTKVNQSNKIEEIQIEPSPIKPACQLSQLN